MTQGDNPQKQVQGIRYVNKGTRLKSIPPASPDEIHYVDTQLDPDTQKAVIFWDDIVRVFDNAIQVFRKGQSVPFLRGGKNHKKYCEGFEGHCW